MRLGAGAGFACSAGALDCGMLSASTAQASMPAAIHDQQNTAATAAPWTDANAKLTNEDAKV